MIFTPGHARKLTKQRAEDYADVLDLSQIRLYVKAILFQIYGFNLLMLSLVAMIIVTVSGALPDLVTGILWYVACGVCASMVLAGQVYSRIFARSINKSLGVRGLPLYMAMVYGGRTRFDQRLSFMRRQKEVKDARRNDLKRRQSPGSHDA